MTKTEQWIALKTRSLWRSLNERQRSLLAVELDICAAAAVAEAREPLVKELRVIEWINWPDGWDHARCPDCGGFEPEHVGRCPLAAALADAKGETP